MSTLLTEEMIVSGVFPDDPQLTPDGSRVAYVAACYGQEGDHPEGTIWVAPTDGTAMARQWTFGGGRDDHPRWSPDGGTLAFLSDRAARGTKALYRMPAEGGEATQLIARKRSIESFAWSPDGARIAFLAPDDPTDEDERREKERDDADVYGERWPYNRLHLLDLATGAVTTLPTGDMHLFECAWSPDGATIAYLARPTPELEENHRAAVFTIPSAISEKEHIADAPGGSGLAWSTFTHKDYSFPALTWIGPSEPVPQCSSVGWFVWKPDDYARGWFTKDQMPLRWIEAEMIAPEILEEMCVTKAQPLPQEYRVIIQVAHGLTTRLVRSSHSTGVTFIDGVNSTVLDEHPTGDLGPFSFVWPHQHNATLATVRSAGSEPPELWVGAPGHQHRVSDHHVGLRDVRFGKQEPFYWEAPDGLALDGILIRPPDAPEGALPTVMLVHGGPYGRSSNGFHLRPGDWGQWLATHGYAVLMPNYRGGMGHGNTFATMARGAVGEGDFGDVMAMVDAAIARGIADPDRLGIGGWSQGGFMTAWAVTQTDRFKAGVMGAGVSDWNMMTMTSDMPTFQATLGGNRPWDGPGPHNAARLSPISYAKNATTPLLMLHGKSDARVPVTQAIGFERALREQGVPTQLVTYPREPHGVRERAHQRDILRRVRAWYDQWLRPGGETK